jgi:hypothetical protein
LFRPWEELAVRSARLLGLFACSASVSTSGRFLGGFGHSRLFILPLQEVVNPSSILPSIARYGGDPLERPMPGDGFPRHLDVEL